MISSGPDAFVCGEHRLSAEPVVEVRSGFRTAWSFFRRLNPSIYHRERRDKLAFEVAGDHVHLIGQIVLQIHPSLFPSAPAREEEFKQFVTELADDFHSR